MGEEKWIKTFCQGCLAATCAIKVKTVDGVIMGLEGDPDNPWNEGKICAKSMGQILTCYDPYRPTKPLVRTNPQKGKGIDPRWKEVEWEEAFELAAAKLRQVRAENALRMLFSSNDVSTITWVPPAVLGSFGSIDYNVNATCGYSVHCPPFMTMGAFHGRPDLKYCKHLVLWGSELGGMSEHVGAPTALEIARKRAQRKLEKIVSISPQQGNIASKADEWIPIRPGTDMAMALAWLHVLVNERNCYDADYLERYTNAPYLVKEDGRYLREEGTGKPLMWDAGEGTAKPFDATFDQVAIEGHFEVDKIPCRTAFQVLKEHVKTYTPEWASPITTVPADTIRRLAEEFGEAAQIGSTIRVDGYDLPYRPATINWYAGISQHIDGYKTGLALQTICLIVGAVNVPGGKVGGGSVVDYPYLPEDKRTLYSSKNAVPTASSEGMMLPSPFQSCNGLLATGYPARKPGPISLKGVQLFPVSFSSHNTWIINKLHPERLNHSWPRPSLIVGKHCNDLSNNFNSDEAAEALRDTFRIAIEPLVDETAEFADIFFPTPTRLERLQLGTSITAYLSETQEMVYDCINISQPVLPPDKVIGMEFLDIWAEFAERAGFLEELNHSINFMWDLPPDFRLNPKKKYTHKELIEIMAKGIFGHDLDQVREDGHIKWKRGVKDRYPRLFFGGRSPIYYEHFIDAGEQLKRLSNEQGFEWDTSEYRPLPYYQPTEAFIDTKPGYDLIAIPYRLPVLSHFWTTHNPWLVELAEHHPWGMNIVMNHATASKLGLEQGDRVIVEAVSGYTTEAELRLTGCIHPEVVGVSNHGGHWCSHPTARGRGSQFHNLIPHRWEYADKLLSGIASCIRVRVVRSASNGDRLRANNSGTR